MACPRAFQKKLAIAFNMLTVLQSTLSKTTQKVGPWGETSFPLLPWKLAGANTSGVSGGFASETRVYRANICCHVSNPNRGGVKRGPHPLRYALLYLCYDLGYLLA